MRCDGLRRGRTLNSPRCVPDSTDLRQSVAALMSALGNIEGAKAAQGDVQAINCLADSPKAISNVLTNKAIGQGWLLSVVPFSVSGKPRMAEIVRSILSM